MGSLWIFATILLVQVSLSACILRGFMKCLTRREGRVAKWCASGLLWTDVFNNMQTFFIETYFELVICTVIGFDLLRYDQLAFWDYFTLANTFVFAVLVPGFYIFIAWFSCSKTHQLYHIKKDKIKLKNLRLLQ